MYFNTKAVLEDRKGNPFREPKDNEKPTLAVNLQTGLPTQYADEQMRTVSHGDMAMMALDSTFEADEKSLKEAPDKWVKAVMYREQMCQLIKAAIKGDGWVKLTPEQRDEIVRRLGWLVQRNTLTTTGQVMFALESAPEEKPGANDNAAPAQAAA